MTLAHWITMHCPRPCACPPPEVAVREIAALSSSSVEKCHHYRNVKYVVPGKSNFTSIYRSGRSGPSASPPQQIFDNSLHCCCCAARPPTFCGGSAIKYPAELKRKATQIRAAMVHIRTE
ncbi:hypothetical protein QQF64_007167 [Cirrhinus molitorella]|uniref:Uncharacterized protein n=1 Tax=Cirrhinus molitorella TaxID=172907 RepID=A0ABR3M9Y0_9TELE